VTDRTFDGFELAESRVTRVLTEDECRRFSSGRRALIGPTRKGDSNG